MPTDFSFLANAFFTAAQRPLWYISLLLWQNQLPNLTSQNSGFSTLQCTQREVRWAFYFWPNHQGNNSTMKGWSRVLFTLQKRSPNPSNRTQIIISLSWWGALHMVSWRLEIWFDRCYIILQGKISRLYLVKHFRVAWMLLFRFLNSKLSTNVCDAMMLLFLKTRLYTITQDFYKRGKGIFF